jgi:soluble lytic murein transglycosylase
MKILPYWATIIQGPWPSAILLAATLSAAALPPAADLALLKAGIDEQTRKQPVEAIRDLKVLHARLPDLADYVAYSLAAAEFDRGDFDAAIRDLDPVWKTVPPSPLAGQAALIAAHAHTQATRPADGVTVLRENYVALPQPAGDTLLAECYRASGDLASAAVFYQQVYYRYPLSPEANEAASALADLRSTLRDLYPPPTTQSMFERAALLAHGGDYRRARLEYQAMLPAVGGPDRELVRVRLGELDYFAAQTTAAYAYLRELELHSEEADAERLYYMAECSRRLDQDDRLKDAIQRLERYHDSPWRLKALVSAGNRYLVEDRPADYLPIYRACAESFDAPQAGYCHWKIAWYAYLHRQADAAGLLREHLAKFPGSEHAPAALYFLGRLAEASDPPAAKSYYAEIAARFPNAYYADLAEDRVTQPAVFGAGESSAVRAFLQDVVWPVWAFEKKFDPTPATQARLDRARILAAAGLEELAEEELRFGARLEDQPHVLAVRLAQVGKYSPPHRALQLLKSLVPGYLSIPIDDAPPSFWRLLFPMPWRSELERNAKARGLDPYIVAGLIRQESEFNPQAVSPAQAYGLMQILPSTGRLLLKVPRRRFRASVLFGPELNLRLGATYLRSMYDANMGRWDRTLAAYNAGASRVENWLAWGEYREPAEFIESIPFSETRSYVMAVLRNASMYRKLYGEDGTLAGDHFPAPPVAAAGAKQPFKRNPVVAHKRRPVHHRPTPTPTPAPAQK